MIDYDPILDHLFVGTYARTRGDVDRLYADDGISGVLNLQTDEDMRAYGIDWTRLSRHYEKRAMEVERVPILDFDPIDLQARLGDAVDTLDALMARHRRVYVHCTAGVCRSPATVIAWLAWCRGWKLMEAMAFVKDKRHCAPYLEAIELATRARFGRATETQL